MLRIRVGAAAELRVDRRNLIGAEARASAERHMLLGMRHPRESGGRVLAASEIVLFERGDWSQRVAHDDDAESVAERGPNDLRGRIVIGHKRYQDHGKQQQEFVAATDSSDSYNLNTLAE